MGQMKKYLRLMRTFHCLVRIKHWIKNLLVFLPIFFAGELLDKKMLFKVVIGTMSFCLISSFIYIINDINDIELDRRHPTKRKRPLASGEIKMETAVVIAVLLAVISIGLNVVIMDSFYAILIILLYAFLNILYSVIGLKKVALVDILILVSGFFLRVFYGSVITGIPISSWLYLVVISVSFYLALGKRRNEIKKSSNKCLGGIEPNTRDVLKDYSFAFLDKNMYMCMTLAIVFYSLWCMEREMLWTVLIVITMAMKYSMDIEEDLDGDPIEVMLADKWLIGLALVYCLIMLVMIYLF